MQCGCCPLHGEGLAFFLKRSGTMADKKRIAVIVRERAGEALRMASGLTLADDTIDVFILDRKLDKTSPELAELIELITDINLKVYSNNPENSYNTITIDEMAKMLLSYDIVAPY